MNTQGDWVRDEQHPERLGKGEVQEIVLWGGLPSSGYLRVAEVLVPLRAPFFGLPLERCRKELQEHAYFPENTHS